MTLVAWGCRVFPIFKGLYLWLMFGCSHRGFHLGKVFQLFHCLWAEMLNTTESCSLLPVCEEELAGLSTEGYNSKLGCAMSKRGCLCKPLSDSISMEMFALPRVPKFMEKSEIGWRTPQAAGKEVGNQVLGSGSSPNHRGWVCNNSCRFIWKYPRSEFLLYCFTWDEEKVDFILLASAWPWVMVW